MASEFPRSPRLLKGGLAVYQSQTAGPPPKIIVFQYNPEHMTRSLAARAAPREPSNVGAAREDVLRVLGPPVETMTLSIELDAADQLAEPLQNPEVVENGLHPVLATLEMLLYPPTNEVQLLQTLASEGQVQVCPADLPLVLLIWGKSRVVPVMLTSFSISGRGVRSEIESHSGKSGPGTARSDLHGTEEHESGLRGVSRLPAAKGNIGTTFSARERPEPPRGPFADVMSFSMR